MVSNNLKKVEEKIKELVGCGRIDKDDVIMCLVKKRCSPKTAVFVALKWQFGKDLANQSPELHQFLFKLFNLNEK